MRTTWLALMIVIAASAAASRSPWPDNNPTIRSGNNLDPQRPAANEERLTVGNGFTLSLVGDLIIARPLSQGSHIAGFDPLLKVIQKSDVAFGNCETSAIDIRDFHDAPYPYDGDWANIGSPAIASDLRTMGFTMVGRANNHVMDWGLAGMRETDERLEEAGIIHAGTGETLASARAAQYFESHKGRVALLSFATTFRPTTEAMPSKGEAPGRPGLSALHLQLRVHVTETAMQALSAADCALNRSNCVTVPATLTLAGTVYVRDRRNFNEYIPDPGDLADIARAIREARQHADFVLVALHSHECGWACDVAQEPQMPAEFLKFIAHGVIDAGADTFVTTGIHNLGPIEVYHQRPIFYGLANFFWTDILEPIPFELYQRNRDLLAQTYQYPERATDYDLTASLDVKYFANDFTFQSVLAQVEFSEGQLTQLTLYPVWLGYGENLRTSGTPRLETRPDKARAIFSAIDERTRAYGLPGLDLQIEKGIAIMRPKSTLGLNSRRP